VKKVQKIMEKVPASAIGKRFEYFLNTGNLAAQHGLELMQVQFSLFFRINADLMQN
jgi:hypothetical protein